MPIVPGARRRWPGQPAEGRPRPTPPACFPRRGLAEEVRCGRGALLGVLTLATCARVVAGVYIPVRTKLMAASEYEMSSARVRMPGRIRDSPVPLCIGRQKQNTHTHSLASAGRTLSTFDDPARPSVQFVFGGLGWDGVGWRQWGGMGWGGVVPYPPTTPRAALRFQVRKKSDLQQDRSRTSLGARDPGRQAPPPCRASEFGAGGATRGRTAVRPHCGIGCHPWHAEGCVSIWLSLRVGAQRGGWRHSLRRGSDAAIESAPLRRGPRCRLLEEAACQG